VRIPCPSRCLKGQILTTRRRLKIVEVTRPSAEADQVVVKMLCAALNRRDMFARQRLYPGAAGNVPILADGVGVVTECGSGVEEKKWLGKRVILTPARG
jgi:NADPH:quinone reductase-like Zn-dependent oxidoreductase